MDFLPAWLKISDKEHVPNGLACGRQLKPASVQSHSLPWHTDHKSGKAAHCSGPRLSHPHTRNGPATPAAQVYANQYAVDPVKPVTTPIHEEDFPCLAGQTSQLTGRQAQWKGKQSSQHRSQSESNILCNQPRTKLSSKVSGKVFRAQVKHIPKRTLIIPISNGTHQPGTYNDPSLPVKSSSSVLNGVSHYAKDTCNGKAAWSSAQLHTMLSSSMEEEKRLLQEMGWREEDSDGEGEDCVIPEQDPDQLEALFREAKERREMLLMRSKHKCLKPNVAADLITDLTLSSSDTSDIE